MTDSPQTTKLSRNDSVLRLSVYGKQIDVAFRASAVVWTAAPHKSPLRIKPIMVS